MPTALMWFRRDLRLHDNTAFSRALTDCDRVYCTFIFDREILDKIENRNDRRVTFIHQCIHDMQKKLKKKGASIIVRIANAREEIPILARELKVDRVYANHDYEPCRIERDIAVRKALAGDGRELLTFKDHIVFEKNEIVNQSGLPFKVYTPYNKAWRAELRDEHISEMPCKRHFKKLAGPPSGVNSHAWSFDDIGFAESRNLWKGGTREARTMFDEFLTRIAEYRENRNFPTTQGVSRLSVHLRFGTVSIRELIREAMQIDGVGAKTWIDELIWREFYNMILHHFPHSQSRAFQSIYDDLPWRRDKRQFAAWCEGRTGYPIVDAAMRELNTTGYMHNRARMIVASFLTKDLFIDWRWGERYFARQLLDYDLSQNLGGWQWSASIGTDAQPYFRVFNPILQSKRFDPEGDYIRKFIPELSKYPTSEIHAPWELPSLSQAQCGCMIGKDYPEPIVQHDEARKEVVSIFKAVAAKFRRS